MMILVAHVHVVSYTTIVDLLVHTIYGMSFFFGFINLTRHNLDR